MNLRIPFIVLLLLLSITPLQAEEPEFLPVDEAFQPSIQVVEGDQNQIETHWKVAEGYYLYLSRISVRAGDQPQALEFITESETKDDPNFGLVEVFHDQAQLRFIPALAATSKLQVEVTYQGCAEKGLCYPPQTRSYQVNWPGNSTPVAVNQSTPVSSPDATSTDTADGLAGLLASSGSAWILGTFFVLGLGLTFTPCVLPMLPILAGAIAGQGEDISARKGLALSLAYVLGMASTYTLAGVLVGYFGASMNLQAAMQNPLALSVFAGVFVLLSLSMFGFYELQLPAFLRDKLNSIGQQPGEAAPSGIGRYLGLALLGLISALVVSPCVSAPLAGALIYISTTGDALLGGAALFALSLGMGVPLLLLGAGGGRFLPKAGTWMLAVKSFFGVLLLALAISLLGRFLPAQISLLLWGALGLVYATHLGSLKEATTGWQKTRRGLAALLAVYALALLIGGLAGQTDPLQPLAGLTVSSSNSSSSQEEIPLFTRIESPADLQAEMASAQQAGLPVVLDFYADWCASCLVMEKEVFRHMNPSDYSGQVRFLQLDVTSNTGEHTDFMQQWGLFGPPAILYFQKSGEELRSLRTVGELSLEEFRKHLQTLESASNRNT
ncbi:protein-disulfide reductase DsbD [Marinospirillum sp.]|uniref:protein-disulfide reductase DsbD n=1 Tax=Marinospirillum sp. TaxID=2183934 RepID=UPI00286FD34D|nr:protein-disulfide reductase DsbD [Marinospirillum sp.]MDR9468005.1 protein-disulfide reductase DsbD [Marinospirillum sp.]